MKQSCAIILNIIAPTGINTLLLVSSCTVSFNAKGLWVQKYVFTLNIPFAYALLRNIFAIQETRSKHSTTRSIIRVKADPYCTWELLPCTNELVDLSLAGGELGSSLLASLGTDPGATQHFSLWEKQTSSSFPHPAIMTGHSIFLLLGHQVSAGSRGLDNFLLSLLRSFAQHGLWHLAHSQYEVTLSWYRTLIKI